MFPIRIWDKHIAIPQTQWMGLLSPLSIATQFYPTIIEKIATKKHQNLCLLNEKHANILLGLQRLKYVKILKLKQAIPSQLCQDVPTCKEWHGETPWNISSLAESLHITMFFFLSPTLPETNSSHLKIGNPKKKRSYSNHPFLGAKAVSFRKSKWALEIFEKLALGNTRAARLIFFHFRHRRHSLWNRSANLRIAVKVG